MLRLNRREALLASALAVVEGTRADAESGSVQQPPTGFIDAHSHIWSRDIQTYPLANGNTLADLQPPSFTAEELMKVARPLGIDRVVLIQHHPYHGWDNSYLTDTAKDAPDVFRIVGMVNDAEPSPEIEMRRLLKQHVTSFRITPQLRGASQWLIGPGMVAMWNCAAETRQSMGCLINPEDLPAVDQMCERFPETPVVIDHFARIGVDGEIRDSDVKKLCRLARHSHTYVKISAFYALGKKKPPYDDLIPMIRRVYESFGPQRLMWASDCPYQLDGVNSYRASLDLIRHRLEFLTEEDRNWLLRDTANNVYFADF